MSIALDLGTHSCRSLRSRTTGLAARRCRSVVAVLADGELQRTWLERLQIPFISCDDHLALPGEHAERISELFSVPCQDLLTDGIVPYADPVTRQLIALIVEGLLPPADGDGRICCFTHPGYGRATGDAQRDFDRRLEFVSRLIRLRGYEPRPLNPAVALGLAEMESEQYTGIALCIGASGCDIALVHRGNPAAVVRLPRGGRSIDEALARRFGLCCQDLFGQRMLDVERARRRKETLTIDAPRDDEQRFVAGQYGQLIAELAKGIERLITSNPLLARLAQPLTLVYGGGATRIGGFEALLRAELPRHRSLGIIAAIRSEQSGEFAVARGCLIHATLDAHSRLAQTRNSA